MQSILAIFNGIKFPYPLMEYVLREAKEQQCSVHVLFLRAKNETREGYEFPSDLSQAETLTDATDALIDDEKIIQEHIKLVTDMAGTENISCTTELMIGCSLKQIVAIVNQFDLVCLETSFDDDAPSMLTNNRFTTRELIRDARPPVKVLSL